MKPVSKMMLAEIIERMRDYLKAGKLTGTEKFLAFRLLKAAKKQGNVSERDERWARDVVRRLLRMEPSLIEGAKK